MRDTTVSDLVDEFEKASAEIYFSELFRGDGDGTLQEYSQRAETMHRIETELRRRGLDALATLLRAEHDVVLHHGSIEKRIREMIEALTLTETNRESLHVSPPPTQPQI